MVSSRQCRPIDSFGNAKRLFAQRHAARGPPDRPGRGKGAYDPLLQTGSPGHPELTADARGDARLPEPALNRRAARHPGTGHWSRRRSTRRFLLFRVATAAALVLGTGPLRAQVPPGGAEAQAYRGLHAAAWRGDTQRMAALIAAGADLNARDAHRRTPLHVATFAPQREAIVVLAQAGADLNALESDRYDAVTIAAVADDEDTLRVLLQLGASAKQMTSRYDGTALIAAAQLGHDGVVRQLIAAGAPLDHVNNLHWTALIEAIVLGDGGSRHVATLRALVQAGASTQLADAQGRNPLALARARGHEAMVLILLQAGAR